jgi:hypothetical protein
VEVEVVVIMLHPLLAVAAAVVDAQEVQDQVALLDRVVLAAMQVVNKVEAAAGQVPLVLMPLV